MKNTKNYLETIFDMSKEQLGYPVSSWDPLSHSLAKFKQLDDFVDN